MNRFNVSLTVRACIAFSWFCVMSTFCGSSFAEGLQSGSRYKIIRPVYVMAVYDDVDNKQLSRETARAYLHSEELAHRYFVAFQCEVPVGTIMTIIGPAPKVWPYLPFFFANRYFVQLDPDVSRGLDVELELDFDMEGGLDGLNPEIFSREKQILGSEPNVHVDVHCR